MNLPPLFTGTPSPQPGASATPDPLVEHRKALYDLDNLLDRFEQRQRGITPLKDALGEYSHKSPREGFRMSPVLRRRLRMFQQELKHAQSLPELRDFAQSFSNTTGNLSFETKSFWRGIIRSLIKRSAQLQKAAPATAGKNHYKFNG